MKPIDLTKLLNAYQATCGAPYKLGAKWPRTYDPRTDGPRPVDCSGYMRWLMHRAGVSLPDGSQNQWAHVRDVLKWRPVEYTDVLRHCANDPTRLFIAFKAASKRGHGHVWMVHMDTTIESHGAAGVSPRLARTLKRHVAACYEVPLR